MFFQSFAVRLKRIVHVACDRSFVSGLSPLAHASEARTSVPTPSFIRVVSPRMAAVAIR
ncbi:hypothetical protein G3N96_34025 [Burkholderia sp. Se-20373]|nr:hypothetical protein [Burkholderia sp. Se-20373]